MNPQLKALFTANALFVFAGNLLVPLYALFIDDIGGGLQLAGMLYSVQFITATVVGLFVMRIQDRSRLDLNLLRMSHFGRATVWLVLSFIPSVPVLLLAQIVTGALEAFGTPAFEALVSEHLDKRKHLGEWGAWEMMKSIGISIASVSSGFLATEYGFEGLFLCMALLGYASLMFSDLKR
jgi:MFS family permease